MVAEGAVRSNESLPLPQVQVVARRQRQAMTSAAVHAQTLRDLPQSGTGWQINADQYAAIEHAVAVLEASPAPLPSREAISPKYLPISEFRDLGYLQEVNFTPYTTWEAVGGHVGVVTCRLCGALVMLDAEIDWPGIHLRWHSRRDETP